jgi:monofunctional biosynthetic peptidoglycan transglycosylase
MNLVPKFPSADKKKEQGKDTKSPQNKKKKK